MKFFLAALLAGLAWGDTITLQSGVSAGSDSRQGIIEFLIASFVLCFGGIGTALWVLENVDEDRRVLRAWLIRLGLGSFSVGWLLLVAWIPFGLPPRWPARYPFYVSKTSRNTPISTAHSQKRTQYCQWPTSNISKSIKAIADLNHRADRVFYALGIAYLLVIVVHLMRR